MNTETILRNRDIKPTLVRMKIYDYLTDNRNHPTADTIYRSLVREIPTLSRTSVYNTMELFTDKQLVQTITIEENETRFDADVSDHGHFKCTGCGTVFDFNAAFLPDASDLPPGFRVTERHLYYKGLCPDCSHVKHGRNG